MSFTIIKEGYNAGEVVRNLEIVKDMLSEENPQTIKDKGETKI
jgi:hypothetical protein